MDKIDFLIQFKLNEAKKVSSELFISLFVWFAPIVKKFLVCLYLWVILIKKNCKLYKIKQKEKMVEIGFTFGRYSLKYINMYCNIS